MGSIIARGMKVSKYAQDIPQLTEYLATNPEFIKYALKVNKGTNKGMSRFQKFLHESAFPEDKETHHHSSGGQIDNKHNKKH